MRKSYILLVLGIWLAILPYLGFPHFWKDILTTISGLGLIYASFIIYKESKTEKTRSAEIFDSFSENKFESETEAEREI